MIDVTDDVPVFDGAGNLLRLLAAFMRRPRRGELPKPDVLEGIPQGRAGLPVMCLMPSARRAGDPGADREPGQLAHGIAKFLREAYPHRAPHALHDFRADQARGTDRARGTDQAGEQPRPGNGPADESSVYAMRAVLERLAQELSSSVLGRDGRVRFRRFGLVNWLMQQGARVPSDGPGQAEPQHDRSLLAGLQEREVLRRSFFGVLRSPDTELVAQERAPWWLWLALRLAPSAWFLVLRALGAEYRWLRRQPYMAPRDPGTFIGFAERLTALRNHEEDPEQLTKLMVNAFLEDLRATYAHRRWRPRAVRRTTYCAALLDGVRPDGIGHLLIRKIIEIRNDTGAFDPLLIVACCDAPLPDFGDDPLWQLGGPVYEGWRDAFLRKGRHRTAAAWYLPIAMPPLMSRDDAGYERVRRAELAPDGRLRLRSAPWWTQRWVLASVAFAVLAAAVLAPLYLVHPWRLDADEVAWRRQHCDLPSTDPDARTLRTASDGECIGVAPHGYTFHSSDEELGHTLEKIAAQNDRADRLHRRNPHRPLVTIIELTDMSGAGGSPSPLLADIREQLQGAASAQKWQLDNNHTKEPLLRIFAANAGARMRHGVQTVDILGAMAKQDASIVGVTGVDESRKATNTTIRALTRAGLPLVSTMLSADSLVRQSPLYFQVSPQDAREAEVALAYAEHRRGRHEEHVPDLTARRIRVLYSSDPSDIYSTDLRTDVHRAFDAAGYEVQEQAYAPSEGSQRGMSAVQPTARSRGRQSCGYPGLVFFAGRAEDFLTFLDGVNQVCGSAPPAVLGDDDVARVAADHAQLALYPDLTYDFLDFTRSTPGCSSRSQLYAEMAELFPDTCTRMGDQAPTDGHAALGFDAVKLYVAAVHQLLDTAPTLPLSAAAVWHALTEVHGDAALDGVSGTIDFGGYVDRQVPLDKLVSVQRISASGRSREIGFCGRYGGERQPDWCPPLQKGQSPPPSDDLTTQAHEIASRNRH